jgi:uncharacterized protein involved in exopolysaccharide biosynthesis
MNRYSTDAARPSADSGFGVDAEVETSGGGQGVSLRQVLHVLFKYRWLILTVFVASLALGKAVERWFITPTYEATSQILLNPGREHVADFSLLTNGAVPPWVRFNAEEETARTVELLSGRFLAERVVRRIGADVLYPPDSVALLRFVKREDGLRVPDPAEREEAAIGRLMRDVTAEAGTRSSIINVSLKHRDPKLAARAVNLLSDLYVERYLGLHQDVRADAFFEEQFEILKHKLRESERKLLSFKQMHGITSSVGEEQAVLRQMQAALRAELNETRSRQAESESKRAELQRQMADHGSLYGNLQSEVLRVTGDARALQAREEAHQTKLNELDVRIGQLERLRDDYSYLDKQLKADEDSYRLYLAKFEDARITGAMDKERIVSVRVIEQAHVPRVPVTTRVERLLAVSPLLGLVVGVVLAALLRFLKGTLDTADDVERVMQLPVLGSLPRPMA